MSEAEGTVVVGYDGSDTARRALGRAVQLAGERGQVLVVHATPSVYPGPYEVPDPQEETRSEVLLDEARELLSRHGVVPKTSSPVGDAADHLVALAEETGAGAIVVGRRRGTLSHLLGSVSSKVVERAPCDVLVVR